MRVRTREMGWVVAGALALAAAAGPAWAQKVPTPKEFLGFEVGADYHLATYDQAYKYFKALEQSSRLIRIVEAGKTAMGKPMIYAIITSEANMAKLDRYKEISKTLSRAKGVSDEQAKALAAEGRAVVYIDGGLHASECAPAQQNLLLAYEMVAGADAETRAIRDNVILVLMFANPDGMDMLAEWYHPNVGTPYEVSPMPRLYHKYVGHDNNRDSYMGNMPETQHINRVVNEEWFPEVLFNQHQTAPFPARIWIHPAAEPQTPYVHPLLVRWQNLFGTAMGTAFDHEGKSGAISRTVFDTWYPGYVTQVVDSHNIISLLTETALYRYATPRFYTLDEFPEQYRDLTVSTFYPSPWKGGWWRLRDAVEYCLTASKAVLTTASHYRQELLYDKYQMGRDTIARFKTEPPYAWVVPQQQADPPTAALMLEKMRRLGVEVFKADKDFVADGIGYKAGTWVVPMTQPFALFAKAMFEEQRYPDLTKYPDAWQGLVSPQQFKDAYLPPYDMAGWTLPYQFHVKTKAVNSLFDVPLTPLDSVTAPAGRVEGSGTSFVLSPAINNSATAVNRILARGGDVYRSREPFAVGAETLPPGAFVVTKGLTASSADALAKELSLPVWATSKPAPARSLKLKPVRAALYQSWTAPADEGWTRWLLEQFEFPFTSIHDAEIRAGELKAGFDVLVIPAMGTEAIVNGHKPGTIAPQYVGGITENGVRNIKRFVEEGGTLVVIDDASEFAIDKLGLPVTDVLKELKAPSRREASAAKPVEFSCPGSVLRMQFDPKHPVAFGMPEEGPGVFTQSPAFKVNPSFENKDAKPIDVVAKYPAGSLLMSGYLKGEKYLNGSSAVLDVPLGKGRVILLGFGVQQRAQPHGTFKLLFNSLYYGASQETGGGQAASAPAAAKK